MALTAQAVKNAKGKQKPYKLTDAHGLYLLITPTAAKYWRFKYRYGGKEKVMALGVFPEVSLADARRGRDDAKALLKGKGRKDPVAARRQEKLLAERSSATTLELIALEWIENQRNRWVPAHAERVLQSLKADIFPDLGARPIAEIEAPELLAVLRKVEARGVHETAQRLQQRCSAVFRFAIQTGRAQRDPVQDLRGALKAPVRANYNALEAKDLPAFLRALDGYDGHLQTKLAIKLLVLTFVRTGELRAAEWEEFDTEAGLWTIPAARMKMKKDHVVPLSRQALGVIEALRPLTGGGRLLFPNQSAADKPMSENTVLYALYRLGYHSRATGHGFRATASTILNESNLWNPDAIERQLAHVPANEVRGAYNRAKYLPERRKMMQWWADQLDRMKEGAKVIPFAA